VATIGPVYSLFIPLSVLVYVLLQKSKLMGGFLSGAAGAGYMHYI
jgi:hypothetical protein